jgi:predicted aminopeptidase
MRARQDIAAIMTDPETDPALVRQLRTAREIIGYATTELGLPASDSYTEFVATGRDAVTWNVVATPEFSLAPKKWCFVVAGCVPYRGYFEESKALASAGRLSRKDMDVAVTPAAAYSTLGWFRDPLLDTMLARSDLRLAAVLVHELAHQRLYLKGQTGFSEAYARFVERTGVEQWLEHSGRGTEREQWIAMQAASDDFNGLLLEVRGQLHGIYGSGIPAIEKRSAKQRVLEQLQRDYQQLVETRWQGHDYFSGWFASDINNAHLALINSYEGAQCTFASLFREAGGDFYEFHRLAAERAKLEKTLLEAWLARDCEAIAPAGDM